MEKTKDKVSCAYKEIYEILKIFPKELVDRIPKYKLDYIKQNMDESYEYNITKDGAPFLSMGVSIKYAEQFKDMLYFLSYYKIERCLVSYIDRINRVCDIIKTLE